MKPSDSGLLLVERFFLNYKFFLWSNCFFLTHFGGLHMSRNLSVCLILITFWHTIAHLLLLWLLFSCVWLFVTPSAVACQAPLSMELPRQEYWSEFLFPLPGNLSNPGLLHWLRFFTTERLGKYSSPPPPAFRFCFLF